ncbi:hypothetical protein DOTSEDRAFT_75139 [Dothistroma septosporum NZE10]|uniref:Macro domain-like protein n=1 Tax=Dothistroma septosporum (strain NZE10 / CBS 128990) TaxID=675120 RepID=M2XIP5_DOTSN|nr:hypothetical protein DOTSEDRAFT_75139 [Dothistroma septosporum NZE10]
MSWSARLIAFASGLIKARVNKQIMSNPESQQSNPAGAHSTKILPGLHLLCMHEKFSDAFNAAVEKCYPALRQKTQITIHNCGLKFLPEDLRLDAVVSPANSYGRLDGAFDDALARTYGPKDDYGWITRKAQKVLYEKWRGFAPPGTCTVVPLDHDQTTSQSRTSTRNPWDTKYLLLCPTVRIPDVVEWDVEVVYECVWSLLCAVDNHNRDVRASTFAGSSTGAKEINTILMTPLGTGVGGISPQRWAEQCVIAMKQYVEAVEHPETWANLHWKKILDDHEEIAVTYRKDANA